MKRRTDRGTTLIELMIAMLVLAIGLGATTIMLTGAMASDNKSSKDMTATLLAQMVMEQISAQHVYANTTINVTDCAGNSWTMATAAGDVGIGSGANLNSDGTIDFTQSYSTLLSSNYAMQYVDCSTAGGAQTTYEVRWNVMAVSSNSATRLITSGARVMPSDPTKLGGRMFAFPVTLRGIGAPSAGQ
ncbi:MAG TPA: prepilin-type N-terminal cleavage/methylation domain-containing protein [Candidatus Acidoferrales bacterium]|nr:prepilin-type N-terminal cleavage/methylation domain-containing protein [Candidatus Acidoferrales bacterium]